MINEIVSSVVSGVGSSLEKAKSWWWGESEGGKAKAVLPLDLEKNHMVNWKNHASQLGKGAVIFGVGALGYFGLTSFWQKGKRSDKEFQELDTTENGKDGIKLYSSSQFSLSDGKDSLFLNLLDNRQLTPIILLATRRRLLSTISAAKKSSTERFDYRADLKKNKD